MRDEILNALKTKFEGVSEKSLGRIADKLANTAQTGEDAQKIADSVTLAQLLESYGDSRANEAAITSVRNYEEKWGIKNGRAINENKPTNNILATSAGHTLGRDGQEGRQADAQQQPDISAIVAKAIADAVSPLQQQLAAFQGERTAQTRRERLTEATKSLPEALRNRYVRDFERMSFADDDDFSAYLNELQPDIKAITDAYSRKAAVGTPPKNPAAVTAEELGKVNPLVAERAARVNNEGGKASPFVGGSAIEQNAATATGGTK